MTMLPSAITMPQDRSMPAVRMMSVWPMARTPTTISCCRMSEKFCSDRKRADCVAKKMQVRTSACSGASTGPIGAIRSRRSGEIASDARVSVVVSSALAPAHRGAGLHVFAANACDRLVGDQGNAGIGVTARLLACLGVFDAGGHTHRTHLGRILLRGRGDHSAAEIFHRLAAAVDRHNHD